MQTILVVFHIFLAIGLIGLILIQHGKGADMGAAFGSGASGTVFGSKGSASFLTRLTAGMATLFFVTSMVMAYFATQRDEGNVVLDALQQPAVEVEAQQPQTDLPPMPAGTTDLPTPPAPDGDEATAPATDVPGVAAPDSADVQATAVEAPAVEPTETAPAESATAVEAPVTESTETAPAESATAVEAPVTESTETAPAESAAAVEAPVTESTDTAPVEPAQPSESKE